MPRIVPTPTGRRGTASVLTVLCTAVLVVVVLSGCTYHRTDIAPVIPRMSQSSRIYAADGTLLTTLHAEQNREVVPFAQLPPVLVDAVVAIEDRRFWEHNGVDLQAVARAAKTNAAEGGIAEGGSTITQQYVKNALLDPRQTVNRKLKEMSLAWQLERTTSKELILELYLNTIYFGHGAYGVEAASTTYFGKRVHQIGLPEAALLAGLIQSPSATDPFVAPEAATERRNVVLRELVAAGKITVAEQLAAKDAPLHLREEFTADDRFPAAHFVEEVKQFVLTDPRFGATEEQRRNLLFGGGLRIHTTVDLALQALGEKAIADVLPDPVAQPDAALVAIDPPTGNVLAMVGGRDFFGSSPYAKVNLAMGSGRQAGSTFKPFVLAAAVEGGASLGRVYKAPPEMTFTLGKDVDAERWTVKNYGGAGGGSVNLLEATIRSYNTVYAQLMLEIGPHAAVSMAHAMGIASPLDPVPSLVLGTENVTVLEMADGYATLANRGVHVAPRFVSLITDTAGTVLFEAPHEEQRAMSAEHADAVTAALEQVIDHGTGTAAQLDRPAAGKTGTAEEYRDAWFVGYTPQVAVAVWVGYAQEQLAMVPPTTPITVTGGTWPAQIWRGFTSEATAGLDPADFVAPQDVVRASSDSGTATRTAAPQGGSTTTAAGSGGGAAASSTSGATPEPSTPSSAAPASSAPSTPSPSASAPSASAPSAPSGSAASSEDASAPADDRAAASGAASTLSPAPTRT